MSDYNVWYCDPNGSRQYLLNDFISLDYGRKVNESGVLTIELPLKYGVNFFSADDTIQITRSIEGSPFYLDGQTLWFVRDITIGDSIVLKCYDAISVLSRRIVAYPSDTLYTEKSDYADDMMKDIVSENFLSGAIDVDRQVSSSIFSVDTKISQGALLSGVECSYKDVLSTLRDIATQSIENGSRIYFDVEFDDVSKTFMFKTYYNQRGQNRANLTAEDVVASRSLGNLVDPKLSISYANSFNVAYVGGQGTGISRSVEVVDLSGVISTSGRIEKFVEGRNTSESSTLQAIGIVSIQESKPSYKISGKLVDTKDFQFGVHYSFGDVIRVDFMDISIPCMVNVYKIKVTQESEEVDARLEGEAFYG